MDDSLTLLARMIVRRHFDTQVPGTQGRSNGAVALRDVPGSGREHLIIAEDDFLAGRPRR